MFAKLRRQAALQVAARQRNEPIYELVAHEPPLGFALLPEPAPGDAFFDMEGDPLYEPGRGLEYLFGCWLPGDQPAFRAFWGVDRAGEKRAFEEFVDFITERRRRYPGMHVYHYAAYEKIGAAAARAAALHARRAGRRPAARRGARRSLLSRPPGARDLRRALRAEEPRALLRPRTRNGGQEGRSSRSSCSSVGSWSATSAFSTTSKRYNRDDCRSTYLLREWLLARRAEAIAAFGIDFPFRAVKPAKEPTTDDDAVHRSELERTLLAGVLPPQTDEEYRAMSPDATGLVICSAIFWPTTAVKSGRPGGHTSTVAKTSINCSSSTMRPSGAYALRRRLRGKSQAKQRLYVSSFPSSCTSSRPAMPSKTRARSGRAGTILSIDDTGIASS